MNNYICGLYKKKVFTILPRYRLLISSLYFILISSSLDSKKRFTYQISYLNLQRYQMKLYALALFSNFNSIIIIWDELARFALRELNVKTEH